MKARNRRIRSIKRELLAKSREAMLTAVQIFNNPNILFKSESFIVLSNIAWTYLLHAYYKTKKIEYRYFEQHGDRKRFEKTKRGACKYWELEKCLDYIDCPVENVVKLNLKFLIGLRHEIEHRMTMEIDDYVSGKFQACCLNYNRYIKELFDNKLGIDKNLSFSLQLSSIKESQINKSNEFKDLPKNIASYINSFEKDITENDYNDTRYSYKIFYYPISVNHKGQADKAIEFINTNSPEAKKMDKTAMIVKEREKPKCLPSQVVLMMKERGFAKFNMYQHTKLWKDKEAKNNDKGFGTQVANTWYWYKNWINEVENHCIKNGGKYKP